MWADRLWANLQSGNLRYISGTICSQGERDAYWSQYMGLDLADNHR
jgi:hypothetical protein